MATNNRDRIHTALDLLGPAVNRYLTTTLGPDIGDVAWIDILRTAKDAHPDKEFNPDDPYDGLRMFTDNIPYRFKRGWDPFKKKLSRSEIGYATELLEMRNDFAHSKPFSNDKTQRSLDTCVRFLKAIGAPHDAEQVEKLRNDVMRVAYDREDTSTAKATPSIAVGSDNLPAWREIIAPHPDVQSGNFNAAEFAADLYTVASGQSAGEYGDPAAFFARTYLTAGLRDLIDRNVRRLAGDMNASPVVNLQTNFGGGKTHSMLALWHLASKHPLTDYPDDVAQVAAPLTTIRRPIQRAALVGNMMEPAKPDTRDGRPGIRTMWGELAWQLGGADAYEIVADADRASTNPGAALRELFELYSPAVILIDEWVAYARLLVSAENRPAGDFETQFTFAQTLTEAAKAVAGIQVVISIPASSNASDDEISDEEVGGESGREALRRLKHVVGRTADQWLPASSHESFEIVRRRIFETPDAQAMSQISNVAQRVVEFYRKNSTSFPRDSHTSEYIDRIKRSYPIHPELFDRLYEDWSTLDRFQRTRGVLRMMNQIVGTLWRSNDASPLILPGTIPLDDDKVFTEVTTYLEDQFKPIINADVAGEGSVPFSIDKHNTLFGKRHDAQRLARAVFMGATPTLHTAHKGVDKPRIFLGTAMPGDVPGNFHSALDQLANESTWLYTEAQRYWYDTQANTTRAARDHAANLKPADVWADVEERLKTMRKQSRDNTFGGVHIFPTTSADIPDEQQTRLVVVPMEFTHGARATTSTARDWAADVVEHRGASNRTFKNSLVFLAADAKRAADLEIAVRDYIAWRYVFESSENLGLGGQQTKQAKTRMDRADEIVTARLLETYSWGIYPKQESGQPTYELTVSTTAGSTEDLIERTGKKLDDAIAHSRSSALIRMDLDGPLASAWESGHISVGQLYGYYATYPYLTRLKNRDSLTNGLLSVYNDTTWSTDGFAFADSYDESTGHYVGLILPGHSENPHLVDSALILKPDVALAEQQWLADEWAKRNPTPHPDNGNDEGGQRRVTPPPPPDPDPVRPNTRYFGSVTLNADLPARDFSTIQQEVLQHLSVPGATVEIRLEISATAADGFDEAKQRIVRENGNVLGFDNNDFEKD
ncbi:ATP-binding protein [Gordonia sp. TBRC 11910]|uniref:ATP-binding protein n=1 Tax=Gordonia asplenii TaxID=2725283 RepID=A0A848KTU5_9ACTN|nr:DUF499 domain-containing protein [Gordonia asplenii]NMO02344.1 ATP-binding protein [Gordonia asplenii]